MSRIIANGESIPEAAERDLPRIWIKPYYPAFNGLRAVAVLVVFFHHMGHLLT